MLQEFSEITGFSSAVHALWVYLQLGGLGVMLPLLGIAIVLGVTLGHRFALLRRGSGKNVRVLIRRAEEGRLKEIDGIVDAAILRGIEVKRRKPPQLRRFLDEAFGDFDSDLKRYASTISVCVAVAPLLGLLGTVMGMIVTFDSLAEMALFTQAGGIAAGISTALFTTQMGLVVAVPGMIAKVMLDRRQAQIQNDLAQIKDILCADPPMEAT
jgi:biopolymer transport protein ExbB